MYSKNDNTGSKILLVFYLRSKILKSIYTKISFQNDNDGGVKNMLYNSRAYFLHGVIALIMSWAELLVYGNLWKFPVMVAIKTNRLAEIEIQTLRGKSQSRILYLQATFTRVRVIRVYTRIIPNIRNMYTEHGPYYIIERQESPISRVEIKKYILIIKNHFT